MMIFQSCILCKYNGEPTISGLDWITLASLRDSENAIFSYNQVEAETAGVTMWGKLIEWFEKAGYEKIFDNISVFSHSNINEIITFIYRILRIKPFKTRLQCF
ncbi:hypothetical protein, partial [Xenorhabdus griffiniae]|uniref:hypothetical protein n=1 Tax=Xenorhabdus griffiniae TaxID=351672 RepID=UPI001CB94A11